MAGLPMLRCNIAMICCIQTRMGIRERNNAVSESWMTKFGGRRVRQEPPTLAEAVVAAQAMSDDLEQQVEMAASLMGLEPAAVRAEVLKARARPERTITAVAPRRDAPARSVVVEYKSPRRTIRAR